VDRPILTIQRLSRLYKLLNTKTKDPKGKIQEIFKTFRCLRNPDVETFLHERALEFELRHRSRTCLWLYPDSGKLVVAGYISLALDIVELPDSLSKTLKKKLGKGYSPPKPYLPAYLIGQLGRNDRTPKDLLPGKDLLNYAFRILKEAQSLVGNRLVIVDVIDGHTDEAKSLVSWYKGFGFRELDMIKTEEGRLLLRLYTLLKGEK